MKSSSLEPKLNFSCTYRLVSKHDFQSVFTCDPKKVSRRYLLALFKANSLPHARLGIIVPKHQVNRAVMRNLIRRIVRESFRLHKDSLKGLDIIILIRSKCSAVDRKELRDNIDQLWPAISLKSV